MVDPSTALYEIADTSSVWADISIFPKYRHSIEEMDSVIFSTRTGCSAEGDIEYISPVISEETRTFMARCELKYACDDFSPGAFVRAKIGLKAHPAAVVVPFNAVQMVDGEAVVFVPRGNNFVQQHVTVGEGGSDFVEITSGLHHGDSYVSEGAFSLKSEIITSGMDPHAGCSH